MSDIAVNATDPATTLAAFVSQAIADEAQIDEQRLNSDVNDAVEHTLFRRIDATVDALAFHPAMTGTAALTQAAALASLIDRFTGDAISGGAPAQQLDTARRLAASLVMFIESTCELTREDQRLDHLHPIEQSIRAFPQLYYLPAA